MSSAAGVVGVEGFGVSGGSLRFGGRGVFFAAPFVGALGCFAPFAGVSFTGSAAATAAASSRAVRALVDRRSLMDWVGGYRP